MGNGAFNCKGCNECCKRRTCVELNNKINDNYGEIDLDKTNIPQRIISKNDYPNSDIKISSNCKKFKTEKYLNNKMAQIYHNNFFNYNSKVTKNDKNISISPSITIDTSTNERYNGKITLNNYIWEMLNFLNKLRSNPSLVIEEIDNILKSNIKIIDEKEYLISDNTNEMIKLNNNFEKIKDMINIQKSVDKLKLENKLKIDNHFGNFALDDRKINELILSKKRRIIVEYPDCFFYPIFIKEVKISIILLLENNKIKEKIFYEGFTHFYVTTFNEKSNRFFSILCLA